MIVVFKFPRDSASSLKGSLLRVASSSGRSESMLQMKETHALPTFESRRAFPFQIRETDVRAIRPLIYDPFHLPSWARIVDPKAKKLSPPGSNAPKMRPGKGSSHDDLLSTRRGFLRRAKRSRLRKKPCVRPIVQKPHCEDPK